jgi:hypothetical protein
MSEVEFEQLLDAVRAAVEPTLEEKSGTSRPVHLPRAANDNAGAWPLIPFPDGWYASC